MTPEQLLDELAVKLYQPPLTEFRDRGLVGDTDDPLAVVMLLVDFETERAMNGMLDFLGNSSGKYARETVTALGRVSAYTCAGTLRRILDVAETANITFETVQKDRAKVPYPVTSWKATHGDKWAAAEKDIGRLEADFDEEEFWTRLTAYVGEHRVLLRQRLEAEASKG